MNQVETPTVRAGHREVNQAVFIATVAISVFAAQGMIQIVPPLLVEIASDFEISVAVAGQLATATFAAWAVSVVAVGPLSDSFGRRPVAIAGLLVLTVSVLASAFAPNIEVLLALRVLTGLGGGTIPPNMMGAVSDVISPAKRAHAIGAMLAVGMLSSAIIVPMVAVLADWGGWQLAFVASGMVPAVGFLTTLVWFPGDSKERVRSWVFFSRYSSLASLRFFRVALAVSSMQRIAFWGTISYFAAYMIDTYDVSVGFVALPLAIVALGPVAGSYCAGYVATQRCRAALMAVCTAGGGVCGSLLFTSDPGIWMSVALATLSTGLLGVGFPTLVSASTEYSGESRATGVGLMGLSNQAGGVLGAGIAGALLASTGYHGVGYLFLGATTVSVLLTPLFGRQFGESAVRSTAG